LVFFCKQKNEQKKNTKKEKSCVCKKKSTVFFFSSFFSVRFFAFLFLPKGKNKKIKKAKTTVKQQRTYKS
jgi:hypothetical protein